MTQLKYQFDFYQMKESELKVAILKRAAKYKKDMIDSTPKRDLNTILSPGDKN